MLKLPTQKVSVGGNHKPHLFMTLWPHYLVRTSDFFWGNHPSPKVQKPETFSRTNCCLPGSESWAEWHVRQEPGSQEDSGSLQRPPICVCQIPHCLFSIFVFCSLNGFLASPLIPLLLWMTFVTFNQWTQGMDLPQVRSYAFFKVLRMCLLLSVLQPTCLSRLLGG